jgi:ketosteroid isomerase-like protein
MTTKALVCTLALLSAAAGQAASPIELAEEVRSRELAFAKTMADRDPVAFASFLAEEAVFSSGPNVSRGRAAVVEAWKGLFEGPQAPFSWQPDFVQVLDSGTLALSSGPVNSPEGVRVGTFNSVWRLEKDGRWRVVFDRGCPPCAPPVPPDKKPDKK